MFKKLNVSPTLYYKNNVFESKALILFLNKVLEKSGVLFYNKNCKQGSLCLVFNKFVRKVFAIWLLILKANRG